MALPEPNHFITASLRIVRRAQIIPLMAKRPAAPSPMLFIDANKRRHSNLFLPKLLAEEADRPMLRGADQDRAQKILVNWADLAEKGHLKQKETALDAEF